MKPGQYKRRGEYLAENGIKRCGSCGQDKPVEQFNRSKNAWDGRYGYCKDCCKPRMTDAYLRRTYGVSLEWYKAVLAAQGGVCAVCKNPETITHPGNIQLRLAVDHDHETGKPRGLLCNRCNCAIAGLENLIKDGTLQAAKDYIAIAACNDLVAEYEPPELEASPGMPLDDDDERYPFAQPTNN